MVQLIAFGHLQVLKDPEAAAAELAANWSVAFLAIAVALFFVHIYSQVLATGRSEHLSFLLNIVLFVQGATIMIALAISANVGEKEVSDWVLPTVVLMVIF